MEQPVHFDSHSLPQATVGNTHNWRHRSHSNNARSLSTQFDVVVGNELIYLDDSKTIPIGSHYLQKFVDRWQRFGSTEVATNRKQWILQRSMPLASDIVQGVLENCWLLSALALVAERSDLLQNILPTRNEEFSEKKHACVRLFKSGKWYSVYVDDQLPCSKSGQLIFSQSKRNQLFVPLIEKAMAKLYGGYHRLSGGYTSEGMTSLTGFPCEILWLPPKKKHFASSQLKLTNNPSPPTVITDLAQQMEPLWSCMVNFVASGFLLSASCGRDLTSAAVQQSFPFTDCESYQSKGLLKNHAYSVLDIVECQDFRLVKLRNPWGSLVWSGDWSDQSEQWTEELRSILVPEGAEEGIFWISFKDLCKYFDQIIVCKIRPSWFQYGYEGAFPVSFDDQTRWTVFELTSGDLCQLSATLYQEYISDEDSPAMGEKPLLAIFVVVFELLHSNCTPVVGSFVCASVCNIQSSVTCECKLEPDKRYLLAVFGFNHWQPPPRTDINSNSYHRYVLRLHSSRPLSIDCYQPNPSLLGDMIIVFVKKCGEVFKRQNIFSYQLCRDWAGWITVVENHDPSKWLRVTMRSTLKYNGSKPSNGESINYNGSQLETRKWHPLPPPIVDSNALHDLYYVASTRDALNTEDFIPPGRCQLINVITHRRCINRQISTTLNMNFLSLSEQNNGQNSSLSGSGNSVPYHTPSIVDTYGLHSPRYFLET